MLRCLSSEEMALVSESWLVRFVALTTARFAPWRWNSFLGRPLESQMQEVGWLASERHRQASYIRQGEQTTSDRANDSERNTPGRRRETQLHAVHRLLGAPAPACARQDCHYLDGNYEAA